MIILQDFDIMNNNNQLKAIASQFVPSQDITSIEQLGEGVVNDTFLVRTKDGKLDYILQCKNKNVFNNIPAMMENIRNVTQHIREKVIASGGDPLREAMTIIPSNSGKFYYIDDDGEYWTASVFIDNTITYNKADSPELARKGGMGIGKFQSMLADFNEPLFETIKGFHNIRFRFKQWDKVINEDAVNRVRYLNEEISWVEARRKKMLDFWANVENGNIPSRVTHNDTKISNILFDNNGDVLCVIDLDTVMRSTSLNDFGDAIRSYTNTGNEDDSDLDRVCMSLDMFSAFTDGYLSQCASQMVQSEVANLAFSAIYITYEQVLRFLMDYIDGDKYYKIKYPEHNLIRTHAQYKLLTDMESKYKTMCQIVDNTMRKYVK